MTVKAVKSKRVTVNGQMLLRPRHTKKPVAAAAARKPQKAAPLRSAITPGTVLILLAGRFRGKRVVFLGRLPSGLLLVTGPYKINGVPLKRVNQSYVIATSTKIDISSVKLSSKLDDSLFQRVKESRIKKHTLMKQGSTEESHDSKSGPSAEKKALQREVDGQLCPLIKQTPFLTTYLGALFSLKKGQAPHNMKF